MTGEQFENKHNFSPLVSFGELICFLVFQYHSVDKFLQATPFLFQYNYTILKSMIGY